MCLGVFNKAFGFQKSLMESKVKVVSHERTFLAYARSCFMFNET